MSSDKLMYGVSITRITENRCGNECTLSNRMIRYDVERISTQRLLLWLPVDETKTERMHVIWHKAQRSMIHKRAWNYRSSDSDCINE